MEGSKFYKNELFTEKIHLSKLITKNGIKNIYDAVSQCTRCGYCLENCPTYVVEKKETHSPRGRNQIVRMLLEGKYKNVENAREIIDTCLLCSACTEVCYGSVTTADIVLEARREEKGFGKSLIYKTTIILRRNRKIFDTIIKILFLIHRTKLPKLADKLGLFNLLGYPSLSVAVKKIIKPPLKFLHEELKDMENKENCQIRWVYFATCGTDYLFTEVGKSTIRVLKKLYGDGIFMNNECCGLVSYNYGSLKDAKELALKNIEIFEKIIKENPEVFIVGDCSSCIAFMKSYPQMFSDDDENYKRAVEFSSRVKDIIEVIKPEHINISDIDIEKIKNLKITIHHSCKAHNDQGLKNNQEKVLKPILKENLIELNESNMCCGGAGAYTFTKPELSNKILIRKISNIAKTQCDIVLVSSTSCLMQIGFGSKEMYNIRVMHYIQLIDEIIKKN